MIGFNRKKPKPKIIHFRGDFKFLSNFSLHGFKVGKIYYKTNEHYFQSMKALYEIERDFIIDTKSPGEAKKLGSKVQIRKDWDDVKRLYMQIGVNFKFIQNENIRKDLMLLKDYDLIEGNTWHDNYWGDCQCDKCIDKKGYNFLGKTLMSTRDLCI